MCYTVRTKVEGVKLIHSDTCHSPKPHAISHSKHEYLPPSDVLLYYPSISSLGELSIEFS